MSPRTGYATGPSRGAALSAGKPTCMASSRSLVHVVDDDDAVRESLTLLLEVDGLEVRAYASVEAFLMVPPSEGCVVTDLHMPGLSGIDLLRALGAPTPTIPVIAITAAPHAGVVEELRALGAFQMLEKPFPPGELVEAVRCALASAIRSSPPPPL